MTFLKIDNGLALWFNDRFDFIVLLSQRRSSKGGPESEKDRLLTPTCARCRKEKYQMVRSIPVDDIFYDIMALNDYVILINDRTADIM